MAVQTAEATGKRREVETGAWVEYRVGRRPKQVGTVRATSDRRVSIDALTFYWEDLTHWRVLDGPPKIQPADPPSVGNGLSTGIVPPAAAAPAAGPVAVLVRVDAIRPSANNPRKRFDEEALRELGESMRIHGLIEPIVIAQRQAGGAYEIVAGERRWRAAALVGIEELPAIVRQVADDETHIELALIENLERQDLTRLEEARGFAQLAERGWPGTKIAERLRRSQGYVSQSLSLLKLPDDVLQMVEGGKLAPSAAENIARFKEFPKIATFLAEAAVRGQVHANELGGKLPFYWGLEQKGLVVNVSYADPEIRTQCDQCPFNAARKLEHGNRFCLKPEHYRELAEEQQRLVRERLAASREGARSEGSDGLGRSEGSDGPGLSDAGLVSLRELRHDQYAHLGWGRPRPQGCTQGCPCYGQALGYDGQPTEICSDPKRYQSLTAKATREAQKSRKVRFAGLQERLASITPAQQHRGFAAAALIALKGIRKDMRSAAAAKHLRAGDGLRAMLEGDLFTREEEKVWPLLEALPAGTLCELLADALTRDELRRQIENKSDSIPLALWILDGTKKPRDKKSGSAVPEVSLDARICRGCERVIALGEPMVTGGLDPDGRAIDLCEPCADHAREVAAC